MIVIVIFYIIMFSLCYSEHLHVIYGTFMLNICNLHYKQIVTYVVSVSVIGYIYVLYTQYM